jgi:hypothetical protein
MGQLGWFLGIRVIRDMPAGLTWLLQDAYINKVDAKFDIRRGSTSYPSTPLPDKLPAPLVGPVDPTVEKEYQQLVGQLAYISTQTRGDTAKAHSWLSGHLTRASPAHITAARHVWKFLLGTINHGMRATAHHNAQEAYSITGEFDPCNEPVFYGASDASFGDLATGASSDGFVFKLYGMAIDWKATKQRSVTKSTTEAELYSLSRTASDMIWWSNFFSQLHFDTGIKPVIYCDNQQTVGIVTKATEKLQTKLKHVNIHQLWLRQVVSCGEVNIQWVKTVDMPADGMTKLLPAQKHQAFMIQLGLEDITTRLI